MGQICCLKVYRVANGNFDNRGIKNHRAARADVKHANGVFIPSDNSTFSKLKLLLAEPDAAAELEDAFAAGSQGEPALQTEPKGSRRSDI